MSAVRNATIAPSWPMVQVGTGAQDVCPTQAPALRQANGQAAGARLLRVRLTRHGLARHEKDQRAEQRLDRRKPNHQRRPSLDAAASFRVVDFSSSISGRDVGQRPILAHQHEAAVAHAEVFEVGRYTDAAFRIAEHEVGMAL